MDCALSGAPIMTHYHVRVRNLSDPEAKRLYLSLDCDPGDVSAFLSEHLAYDAEYQFIWQPRGDAEADIVTGLVEGKDDLDTLVAHYPFGGAIPRPYRTTEEEEQFQRRANVKLPPKPLSKQRIRPFSKE